ncbi:hypothetical protein HIM_04019 [Hirsutella minnesotensis 3608]|uniref:Ubiquitin-like domain-containing protein n=1 Tax=Hirsutella minnesotensis 3608 TaxID=1043627 RepID=A0A0F7ZVI7_9HYPO|nr:hypothetical protein HIM_04019 [Hirsutella minnesotensis 3608]
MASSAADGVAAATPEKMKKLPFKPTALRRQSLPRPTPSDSETKTDDDLALFRRSKEMEPIMAADLERQWKRKQKKQGDEQKPQPASQTKRPREGDDAACAVTDTRDESNAGESPSRRRKQTTPLIDLSQQDGQDNLAELVTPPASKRSRTESTPSSAPILDLEEMNALEAATPSAPRQQSQSLTTPRRPHRGNSQIPPQTPVISLDSDDDLSDGDDVVHVQTIATPSKQRQVPPPAPPPPEDDEFDEYVRKAEQQRARNKAMLSDGTGKAPKREQVDIYVSSKVPNTKPCVLKFLYDKPLRLVRDTWAAIQRKNGGDFPVEKDNELILTWRRQKVYSTSTLLSLGIRPGGDGQIRVDEQCRDGLASDRPGVLMEVWTPDLFREMERQEELRRRREAGELSDSDDDTTARGSPAPEVKLRVILKARDLDDVKLTVRPETTVETLMTGFRSQRRIGSDKTISVRFDGEQLDEHVTMEEADIEDMDTLEVHIR